MNTIKTIAVAAAVHGLLAGGLAEAKSHKSSGEKDAQIELLTRRLELLEKRLEQSEAQAQAPKPGAVAVVDAVAKKKGTEKAAAEYLQYLYSKEGQELAAKHYYRPRDAAVLAKHPSQFKPVSLFTIDEVFGGWNKAQATHFNDGGVFDQIYAQ